MADKKVVSVKSLVLKDGQPASGVSVKVLADGNLELETVVSGEDGTFEVTGKNAEFLYRCSADGYEVGALEYRYEDRSVLPNNRWPRAA